MATTAPTTQTPNALNGELSIPCRPTLPMWPLSFKPSSLSLQGLHLPAATHISYILFILLPAHLRLPMQLTPSQASTSTHPEIPTLLQALKCTTPTSRASSEEAITLGDKPGRGQAGQHSPRADNFLVLMIFAAYSCVEVFFTHLRTTEKAPLEGEGGKSWDTEHSRVTQTSFRSEDRDAPINL